MGFIRRSTSAIGKLIIVAALAATFLFGMVGVVYLSLQGEEIKVPEIIGKDFVESEKELVSLGLRIKKRADRFSQEKPNTVLEQLPKPGETVKTGQMILVVTSKTDPEGKEVPATIKKDATEEDDTEKIEELISDKPKKTNKANTATNKKKSSTTRDVISNNSNSNSSTDKTNSNSNSTSGNKNSTTSPTNKTTNPADTKKPPTDTTKPNNSKTTPPGSGDSRPRRNP